MRWTLAPLLLTSAFLTACTTTEKVGDTSQGTLTPTGVLVRGVGEKIEFEGRPIDSTLTPDGKTLLIKDFNSLRVINADTYKLLASTPIPGGASLTGIITNTEGTKAYVTTSKDKLIEYNIQDPTTPTKTKEFTLPGPDNKGNSFPCGLAWQEPNKTLLITLSINNSLAIFDLSTEKITKQFPTGIAPFGVVHSPKHNLAIVTNQGGPQTSDEQQTAPSAGTQVEVDDRGVAAKGSVSFINLTTGETKESPTGLQPSAITLTPDESTAYVAVTNGDAIAVLDVPTQANVNKINIKPNLELPFGSMPAALTLSPDAKTLYVANSGNNAIAVIDLTKKSEDPLGPNGFIPTDWNPYSIIATSDHLYITNNKGKGARKPNNPEDRARNSHDKSGTIQKLPIPSTQELKTMTAQVMEDARIPQILTAYERSSNTSATPVPIPTKLGEPSKFKHVVYVIKENRTYDQLFGDLPQGDGEPKLAIFGEDVTPNHRKLALDYVLLDNYYCNGVLSADGHSWATEGNVTPYLNRAFGGFTRSYTFGDDPITYSSSGFIWDGVLAAGLSFRNYGEMDYAEPSPSKTGKQIWEDYIAGKPQKFTTNIGIENLRRYSNTNYPGWNMNIPDQLRMDEFIKEFEEFKKNDNFPNFTIVYLPQDHAGGAVSVRSNIADNDLAVGRLVEAISNSQFWKETVIFINEDDPQAGTDHVDGHRSICLVVSPYSKNQGTVSNFYNQTSVLRTIGQIFGIAPMNQQDAGSPLMTGCFNNNFDDSPYKAITPKTPLDEFPKESDMSGPQLALYKEFRAIDLTQREVQTPKEMDTLNRWVWHSMKGFNTRYPSEWAGAHGRGLKSRGLSFDPDGDDDDD